jgi:RNA polymerase sigma-70 factor (ECF subfamily)
MELFKKKKKQTLAQILTKCSAGSRNAQEHLYKEYYGYAMSIALRFSDSRDSAAEILNDGFLSVFRYLAENGADGIKEFKPWLRKIIVNKAIDYYRSSKNKNEIEYDEHLPEAEFPEEIISKMSAEDIIGQLQKLPDVFRIVFILYEIEGYSHKEIGEKLNISEAACRKNLSRAKHLLRTILQKAGQNG